MKKITFLFTILLTMVAFQSNAQYGCASGIAITDGYTATGITSPGNGGPEDWNSPNPSTMNMCQNSTGGALSAFYFDDDVYLFTYTAGANDEEISMTINSLTTWTGLGIFASCTGTFLDNCMGSSASTSGGVLTATTTVASGQTAYIAVGQWGTPNALNFDVTSFSAIPLVNPPSCTTLSNPVNGAIDVAINGNITWNAATGGATDYTLTVGTSSGASDVFSGAVGNVTTYNVGTLTYSTPYYVTIIPSNANGPATGCNEESFTTIAPPPTGSVCSDPLIIGALPYNTTDDTANYGDDYGGSPGVTNCGTTSSYLNGDDVVYAYTAISNTAINVSMTPTATWSGIFVYTDCADIGTGCVAGIGNSGTAERNFDLNVVNGTTYYFVISTFASPQSTGYTLVLTENTCVNSTLAYAIVNDCDVSGGFYIDVEITDMGSATDLLISNDQDAITHTVTGLSTVQFGPYANATNVIVTVEDLNDANCIQSSAPLTQLVCPPECGGNFYDTGGPTSDYSVSENITTTICPDVSGEVVSVTFTFFSTENSGSTACWDGLTIHDGASSSSPTINPPAGGTIWCWDRDDAVPSGTGDLQGMTITSTDASGCLTFVFTSDSSVVREGWEATVSCAPLSIEDFGLTGFSYFPNPINNTLSLRGVNTIQDVAIYNLLGQEVMRIAPNSVNSDVDMSNLQTGTYFVKVTIENATKTIKVIKK